MYSNIRTDHRPHSTWRKLPLYLFPYSQKYNSKCGGLQRSAHVPHLGKRRGDLGPCLLFQVQDLLSFNTEALFRSYTHINILRLKSSSLHRSRFVCRRNLHISGCGTFQRTSPRRFQVETGGNLLSTFSGTEVNLNTWQDCRDNFLCKSAHSFMLYIITFVTTMSVRTL